MEDLEYLISRHLDGALSPPEQAELDARLAGDAAARALLDQYRKLDQLLRTSAPPMPDADWTALATQISGAIASQDDPRDGYKIEVAKRSPWVRRAGWMAVAASVLIVTSIGLHSRHGSPDVPIVDPGPIAQISHAEIHGPRAEPATGPSVAEVKLTAPAEFVDASRDYLNSDGVVVQPSHVTIASAVDRGQ